MQQLPSNILITFGRVLLALYFLLPGIAKLAAPAQQAALMQHHGIAYAAPLLIIAGAAQIIGALLLLSNRFVRFTSFGFVIYILLINMLLHGFWKFTGIEGLHEMQNFIKNLGILAGLLVLAGISAKRPLSIKGLKTSDAHLP